MIAVAETYDVLVTIPNDGSYELRATAQDISGYASAFLGNGSQRRVTDLPRLNYFAMMREMNQMMRGGHVMGQHNPVVAQTVPKESKQAKTMNHEHVSTNNKEIQAEQKPTQSEAHQGHTMPSSQSNQNNQSSTNPQNKKKNKDATTKGDHSQRHYPMSARQGNTSIETAADSSSLNHREMNMDEHNLNQGMDNMRADSMSNREHEGHNMPMKRDTMMDHQQMQRKDTVMSNGEHQGHAMPKAKQASTSSMNHEGHKMGEMTMWGPSMMNPQARPGEVLLNYQMLKATKPTGLNPANPVQNVSLTLTGNMNRYVWGMNGKTLSESAYIPIKKGHTVRFIITNGTMMRHPMHLHGHFFRLL